MSNTKTWPNGFMVVQGNRMEDLCNTYVQWLQRYPITALDSEVLLTQSNGIAQWLKQTLARDQAQGGCGIAAGINAMLPAQFVWRSYCTVLPNLSNLSVYDKHALTWRFYRLLGQWDLASLAPLLNSHVSKHSQSNSQYNSRLSLAQQLADLYDQYQVFRPDWLAAWQRGNNQLLNHTGNSLPLPQAQHWQPAVWRALLSDIDQQSDYKGWSPESRMQLHQRFLHACQHSQQCPVSMPRRVVAFGLSSLPLATLETLKAISSFTQVLLFVMNPSQYYWGDMVEGRDLLRQAYRRYQKRPEHQNISNSGIADQHQYGNPLLASWGKQGRDFLHMFDEWDRPSHYQKYFQELGKVDLFSSPCQNTSGKGTNSLLSNIQDDILNLRSAQERAELAQPVAPDDTSLQFICAHSMQREVEVLHDQLLADFAQSHAHDDRQNSLQAKDILIMVPDIATYAPHIKAVFGRYRLQANQNPDPRFLPYHIADTGERFANPLLAAYEILLSLPEQRLTSSQGLSLLEVAACREHFVIEAADLRQIKAWIKGANIRWALSEQHRQDLGLPGQNGHNTWQFGIDRLLLGYANGPSDSWQGVAPHAEVSGLNAVLLGRLSTFVATLETWRKTLMQEQRPQAWVARLLGLWQAFFSPSRSDASLYLRISQHLQHWLSITQQAQLENELMPVNLVVDSLFAKLEETSLSSRFTSGAINFATLMPMRAVPFRQIWLLGMNDDAYPRRRNFNDFDLIAKDYRPGDRSRRDDDRYLFLEALLSAREKLVLSWHGRNIKDDSSQPPSVLITQLQDYLRLGWPHQSDLTASINYPLQPFSPAYFNQDTRLFTYAHEWQPKATKVTNAPASLPNWSPEGTVTTRDLVELLRSPIDSLYRRRLGVAKPEDVEELADTENFIVAGLQRWGLMDEVISQTFNPSTHATASVSDIDQLLHQQFIHWQQTGDLLTGTAGDLQAQPLIIGLANLFIHWQNYLQSYRAPPQAITYTQDHSLQHLQQTLSVEIVLHSLAINQLATGQSNAQQVIIQAAKACSGKTINWRNVCATWVQHLAAHLSSKAPVDTYLLSLEGSLHLSPMPVEEAETTFTNLLEIWLQAMHRPLPISLNLGMALANPEPSKTDLTSLFDKELEECKTFGRNNQFLHRHYHSFEALDIDESRHLARQLYGAMFTHTNMLTHTEKLP